MRVINAFEIVIKLSKKWVSPVDTFTRKPLAQLINASDFESESTIGMHCIPSMYSDKAYLLSSCTSVKLTARYMHPHIFFETQYFDIFAHCLLNQFLFILLEGNSNK